MGWPSKESDSLLPANIRCAPSPTKYNVNVVTPNKNTVLSDKSDRFIEDKENSPGSNEYLSLNLKRIETPRRKNVSVTRRNLPIHSLSLQLNDTDYEKKSEDRVLSELPTQIIGILADRFSDIAANETTESEKPLSINITLDEYQLLKDGLKYETLQRDNLQKTLSMRDDIIANLKNQVNHFFGKAEEYKNSYNLCKKEVDKLNFQRKEYILRMLSLEGDFENVQQNAESQQQQLLYQKTILSTKEDHIKTKDAMIKELKRQLNDSISIHQSLPDLVIDLQKKCCVIDEMQVCIDSLRQEKLEISTAYKDIKHSLNDKETLLRDLEKAFELKIMAYTQLQDLMSQKNRQIKTQNRRIKSLLELLDSYNLEQHETEMLKSKVESLLRMQEQEQNAPISLGSQISLMKINEVDKFETGHNQINLVFECQQENSFQLKNQLQNLGRGPKFHPSVHTLNGVGHELLNFAEERQAALTTKGDRPETSEINASRRIFVCY